MREWLGEMQPGSLLILDEAHHAAPSSGGRYGIETKFTRAIRDLGGRFEHRLFLSATPHNGHSNSFSTLLELLDPYRFTRGVPVRGKRALEDVMVRRIKEDIREVQGGFPERVVQRVPIDGLPEGRPGARALPPPRRVPRLAGGTPEEARRTGSGRGRPARRGPAAEAALVHRGIRHLSRTASRDGAQAMGAGGGGRGGRVPAMGARSRAPARSRALRARTTSAPSTATTTAKRRKPRRSPPSTPRPRAEGAGTPRRRRSGARRKPSSSECRRWPPPPVATPTPRRDT